MLHSSNYYQQIEVQLEKTLNFEEFSALIDMLALYSHAWLSNQLTLPPYLKRLNQLIAINWFELMQDKIMPWQKYSEFCQTLVTLVGEYNPDTATPKLINLLLEFFPNSNEVQRTNICQRLSASPGHVTQREWERKLVQRLKIDFCHFTPAEQATLSYKISQIYLANGHDTTALWHANSAYSLSPTTEHASLKTELEMALLHFNQYQLRRPEQKRLLMQNYIIGLQRQYKRYLQNKGVDVFTIEQELNQTEKILKDNIANYLNPIIAKANQFPNICLSRFDADDIKPFTECSYALIQYPRVQKEYAAPSAATIENSLWYQQRAQLEKLRLKIAENNDPLVSALSTYQSGILGILSNAITIIAKQLGDAPCEWCFLVAGSHARGDMYQFSDLEIALLLAKPEYRLHPYFQALVKQLHEHLLNIGDPWQWNHFSPQCCGLHIDQGNLNQLLLPEQNSINENDVLLLLQHPVALATWTVDLCLSPDDARFPLAFSLLATQYLAGSAQGKPLFDQFQDTLATQLTPEKRQQIAKNFCRSYSLPLPQHATKEWLKSLALWSIATQLYQEKNVARLSQASHGLLNQQNIGLPKSLTSCLADLMKTWVRQRITGIVHESHYSAEFLALLLSLLYEPNGLAMAGQNRLKALLQVLWLEQTTISIKPWISNGLLNALNKSSKKVKSANSITVVCHSWTALEQCLRQYCVEAMKELNPTWIAILKNHPNNNHLLEDLCKNAQAVLFYLAMIWQINQQSLPQNKHFVSLLKESKKSFLWGNSVISELWEAIETCFNNLSKSDFNAAALITLQLLYDGIWLPLQQSLGNIPPSQPGNYPKLLQSLLRTFLQQRYNQFIQHYNDLSILQLALFTAIPDCPSACGWSPVYATEMQQWLTQLQSLTVEEKSSCRIEGLPSLNKNQYLPAEIVKQLFSRQQFVGNVMSANHCQISQFEWQGTAFYLKWKQGNRETLLGREFAVEHWHRLLGGHCLLAPGWPVKLTYIDDRNQTIGIYYCWLSRAVPGQSLATVMQQNPSWLEEIDRVQYGQHWILTYTIPFEDANPFNFNIEHQQETSRTSLYSFDNGHSFVASHRLQQQGFFTKQTVINSDLLNIKTMIYLLPGQQWLFNERVLSYLQLLDTQETYYFWQKQLKQINVIFKTLLPVTQTALVDLDANVTLCTSERLHLLQQHFLNHPSRLTYEKTLQSLDPIVALSYQFWQGRIRNAQDFMQLDPQAYVPNPKNGKIYSSTSFLQIKTQTINPINLQASLRLPLSYFNKKPFQQLRQNEENNKNQQRFYLELLKATAKRTTTDNNNTDTLEELDLAGCEVIDDGELIELLRFLPNLRRLNIENCRQLGAQTVFKILTNHLSANSFYNKTTDVLCYQLTKIKLTTGFHRKENHTITLTGQHKDRELLASKINPYWQIIHQVLDETNQLSHNNPQNLIIYSRILEKWSITNHDLEKHIVLLKKCIQDKKHPLREKAIDTLYRLDCTDNLEFYPDIDSEEILETITSEKSLDLLHSKMQFMRIIALKGMYYDHTNSHSLSHYKNKINTLLKVVKNDKCANVRKKSINVLHEYMIIPQFSKIIESALLQCMDTDESESVRIKARETIQQTPEEFLSNDLRIKRIKFNLINHLDEEKKFEESINSLDLTEHQISNIMALVIDYDKEEVFKKALEFMQQDNSFKARIAAAEGLLPRLFNQQRDLFSLTIDTGETSLQRRKSDTTKLAAIVTILLSWARDKNLDFEYREESINLLARHLGPTDAVNYLQKTLLNLFSISPEEDEEYLPESFGNNNQNFWNSAKKNDDSEEASNALLQNSSMK